MVRKILDCLLPGFTTQRILDCHFGNRADPHPTQKQYQIPSAPAIQVGYNGKMRKYRDAIAAGVKLTPLTISTGCTLHNEFHKPLKAIIPDGLL